MDWDTQGGEAFRIKTIVGRKKGKEGQEEAEATAEAEVRSQLIRWTSEGRDFSCASASLPQVTRGTLPPTNHFLGNTFSPGKSSPLLAAMKGLCRAVAPRTDPQKAAFHSSCLTKRAVWPTLLSKGWAHSWLVLSFHCNILVLSHLDSILQLLYTLSHVFSGC